jgi:glycosyltransferase involved in cell wall biosynthesis
MKLSLVIPCYNESANIPLIFKRLRDCLQLRQDIEILLVNNGSTDNSAGVFIQELMEQTDIRFHVVNVPVNQGYGYGILKGLEAATGDVLAWTHADMQTDPADVLKAYDVWRARQPEKLLVKGKRQNRAMLETLFTFGMQVVAGAALGVRFDDINAQPKLFSRAFYEECLRETAPQDFSLDLYVLYQAQKQGYAIATIPVVFAKRRHGEAKGGGSWKTRTKLIRRTFNYIFELRAKLRFQKVH